MAEIEREKTIEGLKRYLNYPKPLCDVAQQAIALLKEQEETKTIICQRCGDEIEIKWSLIIKPDMEAIAKRDAFLSDKNGKKLNDAMQSLWGED